MRISLPVETNNFRVELDEHGIAHLVFQPAGGMPVTDAQGHAALAAVWHMLSSHTEVRAVLVRSEGKAFCAGGELAMVEDMLVSEQARQRVMREARDIVRGMIDCTKPIVSAINGAAVGAGLAVALLADISVAARNAKLIDGHTKLGVAAGDHAVLIWPLLCGMAKAKYYLMLCETLSGEEAERIGLVSRVVDAEQLQADALDIARRLATGSPSAIAGTRRSLNLWLQAAWPAFEASLTAEMMDFGQADAKEGVAAIREKRAPVFGKGAG
ncbi:enoyl-CoA hydratase/isomerase family protein [Noviherbaspirillum sp. CPCC 100848]|uniref:Enoyl-CoA hydratase/isomerase family protein n=1 Tax=Noviherbaspirillum album TaxID=3080276 RepID=A0ABU6J978_9BURK|nr:enoyl-CoA hydratase/isomerase family protein [Noviherbaspirillum sp. CPCC 100848]MEC4719832.1 enoyl-CoA hydratase/isomerase family protein [Noviherbaspirillum sp. CPCC 100848]